MILVILTALLADYTTGFRGPHHPKSGVSHHHYAPQKDGLKLTQDTELLHDVSHLKEDMGALADRFDPSKMTEQELEFYYFNFHDTDNNTKLDGLEMLHAIVHTLHRHEGDENSGQEQTIEGDIDVELPKIIELIDLVLEEDDLDNDGYLGYIEYVVVDNDLAGILMWKHATTLGEISKPVNDHSSVHISPNNDQERHSGSYLSIPNDDLSEYVVRYIYFLLSLSTSSFVIFLESSIVTGV